MIANTALLGFAFLMMCAVWFDVRAYTIPNWIAGVMIGLWLCAAPFLDLGWAGFGLSLAAGFGVLIAGMALWAPGWLGGGDVKLLAAGALWFGWPDAMSFLLLSVLAGGVLAVILLVLRRAAAMLPLPAGLSSIAVLGDGKPVPYAVAIAVGAMVTLPNAAIFSAYTG